VAEHPQLDIGIAQPVKQGTPHSARCAGDQHKPRTRHNQLSYGLLPLETIDAEFAG
jgi:hypothetical protein